MNTNQMCLTRVFTTNAAVGGVLDETPNETGGSTSATFWFTIEAEAGENLGSLLAAYDLVITANSTTGGTPAFAKVQRRENVGSAGDGWTHVNPNLGWRKSQTIAVTTTDFPPGEGYELHVRIVGLPGSGILCKMDSNEFYVFP
ncbi:hypothetical protein [Streptomyces sp. NPDC000405]|uniref:hypothetical protein n=1 Tax=Streptomyces sp. NPDC000405 TaxID=3161033 RepID=UPI00398CE7AF